MIATSAALILLVVFARLGQATPAGRWLHRMLVEWPLASVARIERHHILFLIVAVFAVQAFAFVGLADMALVAAWDVSLFVDAAIAVTTMSAVARARAVWSALRQRIENHVRRVLPPRLRARAPRSPRRTTTAARVSANDDDEGPARRAA